MNQTTANITRAQTNFDHGGNQSWFIIFALTHSQLLQRQLLIIYSFFFLLCLPQNATIGSSVFQVIAKDPDNPSTPSGKIKYRIQSDSQDAKSFKIDALTGLVMTTKRLDREVKDSYNIIIEVSDMGEPAQVSNRVLVINVIDIDDHKPHFHRDADSPPLEMEVMEEQARGTPVGLLTAIDEDIGSNGAIDYAIVDGNEFEYFQLTRTEDNKAQLITAKPLDREKHDKFLLTIKCFKLNHLKPTSMRKPYNSRDQSEIQVQVRVLDIDDHLPEFNVNKNESVGVRHNVPINTLVATIKTSDEDSSAAPIHLSIERVKFVSQFYRKSNITADLTKIFALTQEKIGEIGEIRNAKSLIDFVDGYFDLTIRANNSNVTRRYSELDLKIYVIRDKSLLRFVFARPPSEVNEQLSEFSNRIQNELKRNDLELSIFDAQVLSRPDHSLDFSSTISCFQLSRHGSALPPHEMMKIMDSEEMKQVLLETYVAYDVHTVEPCAGVGARTAGFANNSGTWLVLLAAVIALASLMALLSTCCLFKK